MFFLFKHIVANVRSKSLQLIEGAHITNLVKIVMMVIVRASKMSGKPSQQYLSAHNFLTVCLQYVREIKFK